MKVLEFASTFISKYGNAPHKPLVSRSPDVILNKIGVNVNALAHEILAFEFGEDALPHARPGFSIVPVAIAAGMQDVRQSAFPSHQ